MKYDEHEREVIRALSWDEMKARMPTQAAHFFTQHHPLLIAYKHSLLGEKVQQAEVTHTYFMQMPPEQQYGLVIEMGAMTLMLAQADLAASHVGKAIHSSTLNETSRFSSYGINIHLSKGTFELLLRAISDQHFLVLQNISALEMKLGDNPDNRLLIDSYKIVTSERQYNQVAQSELLAELKRFYPSLVPDAKSKG